MALLRPTVWTQQPQSAVEIDWSNPITRGLALTLCPTNGFIDAITGEAWQTWGTAPAVSIGQLGKCVDSTAAWGGLLLASNKVNLTTEAQTHLIVCDYVANTGNYAGLFGTSDLSGANNSIILQDVDGEHLGIYPSISSLGSTQPFSASTLLICGDALNSAAYKDSMQILSGGPAVVAHSTGRMILFGERLATTSYATRGKIYLSLSWTRRLSASEIASVSENPWQIFKPIPRRIFVPVGGATGPQDLYPNLFTNDQTFYSHTLSQSGGTQTLTPSLYTNDQAYYTHTLSATKALTPSLYTNSQDFYGQTLSATKDLAATLHTNSSTFYGPSVSVGTVTLTPALFTNSQSFYAPVVQLDGGPQYIAPDLYTGSQTFYGATVQPGAVAITPSLYSNDQTFYSLTVTTSKTLTATLFTNDQTFYAPIVSLAGGPQYVVPSLHTNVESFFSATVSTGAVQLYPALYTNTQTFYTAAIGHVVTPDDPEIVLLSSPLTRTATLTSILR